MGSFELAPSSYLEDQGAPPRPEAVGCPDGRGLLLISILMANGYCARARSLTLQGRMHGKLQTDLPVHLQSLSNFQMDLPDLSSLRSSAQAPLISNIT